MERFFGVLGRLLIATWLGGGVFLTAVAAPAAFSESGSPETAANIVGRMLSQWHWISVVVPLLALIAPRLRRRLPMILIVLSVTIAAIQWELDNRIHETRVSRESPISELDPGDPLRRRFGMMHGTSMMLLIGQLVCGAVVVAGEGSGSPVEAEDE